MKPRSVTAILLVAVGAGFAAGWFPWLEEQAPPAAAPPRPAATYDPNAVAPPPVAAPIVRELGSVEDCRDFLASVNRDYASSHPYTRRAIRDYALRRWLELDAESALTEAERLPGNEFSVEGFAPDLFRVWLDLNVDSAISAWNQANPILARNVRLAFLTALADKDPERAYEAWKTPRGQRDKDADPASEEIFRRWAQRDPRQAIAKAPGSFEQSMAINEWAQNQPKEALAYVKSMKDGQAYLTDPVFLPLMLQTDSARARAALQSSGRASLEMIGHNWAERDTAGAVAWAQSQPAGAPLVREVFVAAAGKLAWAEPERALEILRQQSRLAPPPAGRDDSPEENPRRQSALREAFAALAAADPNRMREIIASEPDLAKGGGMAGYFSYAFSSDPASAIAAYREWAKNPALKDVAMEAVLSAFDWSRGAGARDPSELLAAVPELADKVQGQVLSGWAKANPMAAAEFITQRIAAGKKIQDLPASGVLADLAIAQPQYTSLWLQRVRDPDLQEAAAGTLAANWSAFDPAAAAAWINSLPEGPVHGAAVEAFERRNKPRRDRLQDE